MSWRMVVADNAQVVRNQKDHSLHLLVPDESPPPVENRGCGLQTSGHVVVRGIPLPTSWKQQCQEEQVGALEPVQNVAETRSQFAVGGAPARVRFSIAPTNVGRRPCSDVIIANDQGVDCLKSGTGATSTPRRCMARRAAPA